MQCSDIANYMYVGRVAIGYDEGTIMIKIGREEPVASMDGSGKIIWAKHNEIQTVNVKAVAADSAVLYLDIDTWSVFNKCQCRYWINMGLNFWFPVFILMIYIVTHR